MTKHIQDSKISAAEIRRALERSGYLLEARVAAELRRGGFDVLANPPYEDPFTEKSREIDIVATLTEPNFLNDSGSDHLSMQLVMECVNPPQPVAFLTAPVAATLPSDRSPLSFACLTGWPRHMPLSHPETNWNWLWGHTDLHDRHHYAKCRIATQFCSFERKRANNEWFATHREADYESFRALSTAFDYTLRLFYSSDAEPWTQHSPLQLAAAYPVMVVQGQILEVRLTREDFAVSESQHLTFLRSFSHAGFIHDHLIDVVTEIYFPSYLRMLKKELNRLATNIRNRNRELRGILQMNYEACRRDPRCWGH